MDYEIRSRPGHAMLAVTLAAGEQLCSEPGRMATRTPQVTMDASVTGGDGVVGVAKRVASDERDLGETTFYAHEDGQTVRLAPNGHDVVAVDVGEAGRVMLQAGDLLAWEPLVERSTSLNDASQLFSTGELTVLELTGRGLAFISTYGAVEAVEVIPDDPLTADEQHVVGWTGRLELTSRQDGSLKSSVVGGEFCVTEFHGTGTVWIASGTPPRPNRG